MSLRNEQCNKVCRILDDVLANRPTERDSIITAVRKAFGALETEPQWIPVSERMPRDGTWNIFTDGKNISVERYKADAIDHFFPNGRWFQLEDVIAWMPLPAPYTK